jgi:hypothetical protein
MARIVRLAAGSAFGLVLLFGAATALHSSPSATVASEIVCGDGYCCQTEPYFYCWRTE